MSCNKKVLKLLRRVDYHGHPINLTYKNKQTFQTSIGGIVTIISRIAVLSFFFTLVSNIVNKQKTVTFKSIYKSATNDYQDYHLNLDNFDLAFSMQFNDGLSHLNEKENLNKYVDFNFEIINSKFAENSEGQQVAVRNSTALGYERCNNSRFANSTDVIANLGIDQVGWYCVKDLNIHIIGQITSIQKQYFRLIVSRCQNSTDKNTTCAPQEEIDTVLSLATFGVAQLSSYFDQDEFVESPVQYDITNMFYNFRENQSFSQFFNVKKNMLTTKDFWLSSYFQKEQLEFYQIQPSSVLVGDVKKNLYEMFTLIYACGDEEIQIERTVTTLVDIISVAGGFSHIIILAAQYVALIYSGPLYYKKFLSKLYKVSKQKIVQDSPKTPQAEASKIKKNFLDQVYKSIMQRQEPKINTFFEYLKQYMVCVKGKPPTENSIIYHNGVHLIEKSMDIMTLIKSVRKFKIAIKLLLQDYQYQLLPLMTKNLIPTSQKIQILRRQTNYKAKSHLRVNLKSLMNNQTRSVNSKIIQDLMQYCGDRPIDNMDKHFDNSTNLPQVHVAIADHKQEQGNMSSKALIRVHDHIGDSDVIIARSSRRHKDKHHQSSKSKGKKNYVVNDFSLDQDEHV